MKTRVLIVTDNEEQALEFRDKNKKFVKDIKWLTRDKIIGDKVEFRFATPKNLESIVCGMYLDVVINLSSADPKEIYNRTGYRIR